MRPFPEVAMLRKEESPKVSLHPNKTMMVHLNLRLVNFDIESDEFLLENDFFNF